MRIPDKDLWLVADSIRKIFPFGRKLCDPDHVPLFNFCEIDLYIVQFLAHACIFCI